MPISGDRALVSSALAHVRRTFAAGILTAFPLIVTWFVLRWVFGLLDGLFAPLLDALVGFHVPGLGFLVSLAVFYLFGMISANVIGRQLQGGLERLMSRLPVLRAIYSSAQQVVETFGSRRAREGRQRVVLVEFPAKGHYMVGFVTRDLPRGPLHSEGTIAVFVPTAPNPTSGALLFLPESAVIPTGMTTEEAFKIVLSGGSITPESLKIAPR